MSEKTLSVDDILALDDLQRDTIDVPEWGGKVEVRELTAAERGRVGAALVGRDGKLDMTRIDRVQVMAATFGLGLDEKHFEKIGGKKGEVIERIANKVMEMSGMEAEAVTNAEDFLPVTQNGDSPSD